MEVIMFSRIQMVGFLGAGLIALLGTKADAHYMYASGRYIYHSVGCIAEIEAVPNPAVSPAVVECIVVTAVVETLCQDASGNRYPVIAPLQVSLSAQASIVPANVTAGLAEVEVVVPDSPLLNVNLNLSCTSATPIAVLIRNMAPTVTVFRCVGSIAGPCAVRLMTSTATALCELPAQYSLDNYPANLPPDGTPFACTDPLIVHPF
jgi:hypothetical protein